MTRIPLTFSEARAVANRLWDQSTISGYKLQQYPRGDMGMTLNSSTSTPEYKADKAEFDMYFRAMQDWNKVYVKQFKKEIQAFRAARLAEKIAKV